MGNVERALEVGVTSLCLKHAHTCAHLTRFSPESRASNSANSVVFTSTTPLAHSPSRTMTGQHVQAPPGMSLADIENPALSQQRFDFPVEEQRVLEFWREIDAFHTSLRLSEGRPPFSFYDGPPFATGLPHYGHLLAGTIKVGCYYVRRRHTYVNSNPPFINHRTWSRATLIKLAITWNGASAGIAMDFRSNMRLTRSLVSRIVTT